MPRGGSGKTRADLHYVLDGSMHGARIIGSTARAVAFLRRGLQPMRSGEAGTSGCIRRTVARSEVFAADGDTGHIGLSFHLIW